MTDAQRSVARIELRRMLTVRATENVHAGLATTLDQHAMAIVACSAATQIDLSLFQPLLATRRTAQRAGGMLRLTSTDNAVLRAALLRGGFVPTETDAIPGTIGPDTKFWPGTVGTA